MIRGSGPSIDISRRWLPGAAAAALALIVYAVTLGGSYVYDDTILQEDPRFTHVDRWGEFWTKDYWARDNSPDAVDKLYRPLTCMTFAVEYWIHGDRPWLYHLVNILLHAAVAALVAELGRRLMGWGVGLIAGVLFAVHPIHVEAIAGLVGRAELLCTGAIALALILFLKRMTPARIVAICACLIFAILSKEQGIFLPAILLALLPFRRWQLSKIQSIPGAAEARRIKTLVAAVCLITAGYLVFREQLLGFGWDRSTLDWTVNPLVRSTGVDRIFMPLVLLGRYLALLLAPVKLSLDYGTHVIGWTVNWRQPWIYLGMGALVATALHALCSWRRRDWAALFCLAALAISYGMVSNAFLLIGTLFGERLMYLPSVFFLILLAGLLVRLIRPVPLTILIALLTLLAAVRSFTYARLWNDPLKLYLANLADHPQSMHLHGLAVHAYLVRGDYHAARAIAEDCLRRLPDSWQSYQMCVAADLMLHDYADAERVLTHPDPRVPGLRIARLHTEVEAEKAKEKDRALRAFFKGSPPGIVSAMNTPTPIDARQVSSALGTKACG